VTKRETARRAATKRQELRNERITRELLEALVAVIKANRRLMELLVRHAKGEA
jgi:hypothetical protein